MIENNKAVVKKVISKSALADSQVAHDFARRECMLHASLDHPNIIKLFGYSESQAEYLLFMEYAGANCDYL